MDLETENRLASLLMEEARRLRLQADKEGVNIYLRKPNVRGQPNSRFLTATVLGVQQANRVAEVNEMWRARDKELELDSRIRSRSADMIRRKAEKHHNRLAEANLKFRQEKPSKYSRDHSSSSKYAQENCYSSEDGMRDEEMEHFLQSRAKRGRGSIGSRMDEPGPYLPSAMSPVERLSVSPDVRVKEEWERCVVGPEKPSFLQTKEILNDHDNLSDREREASHVEKHHKKHESNKEKLKNNRRKESESKHHLKSRSSKREKGQLKHH